MSLISSSWCFSSFKKAARAASIFTIVMHTVDIALLIYAVVTIHQIRAEIASNIQQNFIAPGLDIISYICLAMSLIVIIISGLNLSWIKQGYPRTPHMMMWIYVTGGLRVFEACLGIYILAYLGEHNLQILAHTSPVCIIGALYWCGSTGVLVVLGFLAFNYVRELKTHAYGGQRRHKPYMIHTNDIYSPTTTAILSAQDDDGATAPPIQNYRPQKRHKPYYDKDGKKQDKIIEFESIV